MDIKVIESGSGGDLQRKGNDLAAVFGFENMPYLGLFGGNIEQSTPLRRDPSQQAQDYWGNSFMPDPSIQFNSETERMLRNGGALTSAGRLRVEGAIKKDLEFMKPFARVSVSTRIRAVNELEISIGIVKPDNLQQQEFIFIWDSTRQDLITDQSYVPNPVVITDESLQYELQFYL